MSDHWEFYPRQRGARVAFVSYDHGIGETIDALAVDTLLKVTIRFDRAGEPLPGSDEHPVLSELEDAVRALVEAQGGAYVGRITAEGQRTLYAYAEVDPRILQPFLEALGETKGYALSFAAEPDPQKRGYWAELRPTSTEWRVLLDLKVIEALREHGDGLRAERPIDHFARFPTPEARSRFRLWAEAEGYLVTGETEPTAEAPRYGLQVTRNGVPRLSAIAAVTLPLMERIESLGGDYDGWGTRVVPSPR